MSSSPRNITQYPRMYEGRVSEVIPEERQFKLINERYWLTLRSKQMELPQVGQYVYADATPEGIVKSLRVRTPLRDRLIRQQEAGIS